MRSDSLHNHPLTNVSNARGRLLVVGSADIREQSSPLRLPRDLLTVAQACAHDVNVFTRLDGTLQRCQRATRAVAEPRSVAAATARGYGLERASLTIPFRGGRS